MNMTHEIRNAYITSHENEMFSMYFTGDIRPLINDKMTPNDQVYSGRSTRLVGGANAYWKNMDGYFFVVGSAHEMKDLYDIVVRGYDTCIISINGTDVISIRQIPKAAPKVVAQTTVFDFTEQAEQAFFER